MNGGIVTIIILLIMWGLPILKKILRAKVEAMAQPEAEADESEQDVPWEATAEAGESQWDAPFEAVAEEPVSEEPFGNYFSYETVQPEKEEAKATQAEPARKETVVEKQAAEASEFDLRQAVIYQTILQNNYLSEWK